MEQILVSRRCKWRIIIKDLTFSNSICNSLEARETKSLYQKDLYVLLGEKWVLIEENKWNLLVHKALGVIMLTLSKSITFNIKN